MNRIRSGCVSMGASLLVLLSVAGTAPAMATESVVDATGSAEVIEVVVTDKGIPGSTAGTFSGTCPPEHPYLARFTSKFSDHQWFGTVNDLAPLRINPGGVQVLEPGGIAVSTHATDQEREEVDPNRWGWSGQVSRYKGITGDYMNWNVVWPWDPGTPLKITMLCTNDPFGHGTRLYKDGNPL